MTNSLLMCAPEHYEVAYEINPWMSVKRQVNQKLAMEQWTVYHKLLTETLKVPVELIKPVKGLPDMVFTANAGMVHRGLFVRSNFRHKERRGEEIYFEKWFQENNYTVSTIERPFCFEGEGDALFMASELYTGFHFRSDVEAHDQLAGMLRMPYYALELCDKRFYHLDTCFAPLDEKSALVNLKAFEPYAQLVLIENIPDLIKVPEEEALEFACNAVVVGRNVILPNNCPKTVKALKERGFQTYELAFSEFIKAGGAAKCLVLKI